MRSAVFEVNFFFADKFRTSNAIDGNIVTSKLGEILLYPFVKDDGTAIITSNRNNFFRRRSIELGAGAGLGNFYEFLMSRKSDMFNISSQYFMKTSFGRSILSANRAEIRMSFPGMTLDSWRMDGIPFIFAPNTKAKEIKIPKEITRSILFF
jgi:hypothetical protein